VRCRAFTCLVVDVSRGCQVLLAPIHGHKAAYLLIPNLLHAVSDGPMRGRKIGERSTGGRRGGIAAAPTAASSDRPHLAQFRIGRAKCWPRGAEPVTGYVADGLRSLVQLGHPL
jgi:hypothetical protein